MFLLERRHSRVVASVDLAFLLLLVFVFAQCIHAVAVGEGSEFRFPAFNISFS